MVAVKLAPSKDEKAEELRKEFGVSGYPTMILADAQGNELDRLTGFLSPDEFLEEIQRIQSGDTFAACLERLDAAPGDAVLLERTIDGLLARYDLQSAFQRLEAFSEVDQDLEDDPTARCLVRLMTIEHSSLYRKVGRQYQNEWQDPVDVSQSRSTPALGELMDAGLPEMEREEQAESLREARQSDAVLILHVLESVLSPDEAYDAAFFAYRNGHYDVAAELYKQWYQAADARTADQLNGAAWSLYLARADLDFAVEMAREAYAEDSSPNVADTLAQILYVSGATEEAIEIESRAAEAAEGKSAEVFAEIVETMKAGGAMTDKPEFETYPG